MLAFLTVVCVVCLIIAAWGFLSVQAEVAKRNPIDSLNSVKNRFAVDPFIWSKEAPRGLRRRYVFCSACLPLGMLCFAYLALQSSSDPEQRLAGIFFGVMGAVIIGVTLLVKVIRHGF